MAYEPTKDERRAIAKRAGQKRTRQPYTHEPTCRCISCKPHLWAKLAPEDPNVLAGQPQYTDENCIRMTVRLTPSLYAWLQAMAGDPAQYGRANNGPSAFARRILLKAKEIYEKQRPNGSVTGFSAPGVKPIQEAGPSNDSPKATRKGKK